MFDWDGTLYQSVDLIEAAIVAAGESVGHPIPKATARYIIGMGLNAAQELLFPGLKPDPGFLQKFHRAYREYYQSKEDTLELYPGAQELLRDLAASGVCIAVATAKSRAGIRRAIEATGVSLYIQHVRTAEDCLPKPDPQMVDEILKASGIERSKSLVVGDTIHDIQMGHNARVKTAALAHGAHSAERLAQQQPTFLCTDFSELRQVIFGADTAANGF
ncbi:MAG: HAD-IIIA family hydrolase [Turneriella sp.]|nr:HAD-IIIA family hydrolase [Turneriella sp.]